MFNYNVRYINVNFASVRSYAYGFTQFSISQNLDNTTKKYTLYHSTY